MPDIYVLDSFAVLALVEDEPARVRVEAVLNAGRAGEVTVLMSTINAGEVLYHVERASGADDADWLAGRLELLPVALVDASWPRVIRAAHLRARHRMSYADAFAVDLAQERGATLLTGDPELRAVEHLITIEWLPR